MRQRLPRKVDANASVICRYPTGKRAGPRCRFDCHEIDSVTAGRSGRGCWQRRPRDGTCRCVLSCCPTAAPGAPMEGL